jgi:hypothetical protein
VSGSTVTRVRFIRGGALKYISTDVDGVGREQTAADFKSGLGLGTGDTPTFAALNCGSATIGDASFTADALFQFSRVVLQGLSTAGLISAGLSYGTKIGFRDGIHVLTSGIFTRIMLDKAGVMRCRDTGGIDWYNGTSVFGVNSPDVSLRRGGPGILQQRNGLNTQWYDVFGTYTSDTSFEKLRIGYSSADGGYLISQEIGSAGGTARDIKIGHRNAAGTFATGITVGTNGQTTIIPPTSDPGIAGALWNNGGTLAISAG